MSVIRFVNRAALRVPSHITVGAARILLARHYQQYLAVVQGSTHTTEDVVGIVSEGDLRFPRDGQAGLCAEELPISSVMSSPVIGVTADVSVQGAENMMRVNRIGCLAVYAQGRFVGLFTKVESQQAIRLNHDWQN